MTGKALGPPFSPLDFGIGQLFWKIPEAVIVGDAATGRIVLWNPAAAVLFGYSDAEAVGMSMEALVPEELRARHRAGLDHYNRTGHGSLIESSTALELPALRHDGEQFLIELTLSPVEEAPSPGRFVLGVIRDVTERRRRYEERLQLAREQAARAEAEAAIRMRDEFLSVAAHELKTPITSLRGFAQLLKADVESGTAADPGRLQKGLDVVDRQAAKLAELVGRLLDLSRIQVGRLQLERWPTDLGALVLEAAAAARVRTRHQRIDVRVLSDARVVVWADPARLEQVVTNLLDNAAKYGPADGRIEISLSAPAGGTVRIAVIDQGPGVPPEHRERIFERFQRVGEAPYVAGLGLGLYVSREIVELHGGAIEVADAPDGGASFVVVLPLDGADPAGTPRADDARVPPSAKGPHTGPALPPPDDNSA